MKAPKIAVIWFPGNNCENETKRALELAGLQAKIVRSNDKLSGFDGYVLPGGFSYEDRVRAGAIAAKESVIDRIREEAAAGKPVLGICNGAQVIVESGLVGDVALAPNRNTFMPGFYCTWVLLKSMGKKTPFTYMLREGELLPMPIAHAEGRFTSKKAIGEEQIMFQYCGEDGQVDEKFPANPNGSVTAIAGLANREGNVLALMPHPERASWMYQLPADGGGDDPAPANKIFASMRAFIEAEGGG